MFRSHYSAVIAAFCVLVAVAVLFAVVPRFWNAGDGATPAVSTGNAAPTTDSVPAPAERIAQPESARNSLFANGSQPRATPPEGFADRPGGLFSTPGEGR